MQGKLSVRFYDSGFHTVTPPSFAFSFSRTCELEGMFKENPRRSSTCPRGCLLAIMQTTFFRFVRQRCSRLIVKDAGKENGGGERVVSRTLLLLKDSMQIVSQGSMRFSPIPLFPSEEISFASDLFQLGISAKMIH